MARPAKVNIDDLINDVDEYIETAEPPIVAEYAHMHGITRHYLYMLADKHPELLNTLKKITEAKEIKLEKNGMNGKYNSTMAIFSLKQLGWRDSAPATDEKALEKLDGILGAIKDGANNKAK